MTGEEFLSHIDYFSKAWLPARDIVKDALAKRLEVDPSGAIAVFQQVSSHSRPMLTVPSLRRGRIISSPWSLILPQLHRQFSTFSTPKATSLAVDGGYSASQKVRIRL